MRKILACLCVVGGVQAAVKTAPEPAYDADLFSRDRQVFSLHGSFLFWRVQEGALDYALKRTEEVPVAPYAFGKYETATYSGEPGFRVTASFFRAPKYWEIWGTYTRLTARGKDETLKPTPDAQYLVGTWPQLFADPVASAKSWVHFNYNTAELLVDRFFNPNPHLRLRLLGGALVTWMSQNWKVQYESTASDTTKVRSRWNYTAGGLRAGVMADWFWGYDIYVTALTTLGVTLGTYHNQTKIMTDADGIVGWGKYQDVRPAFTAQVQFGPSWQKSFSCTRWEVFAGYELNTWLNLQEIYRSSAAAAPEDSCEMWINTSAIAMQGLTARLTVDF